MDVTRPIVYQVFLTGSETSGRFTTLKEACEWIMANCPFNEVSIKPVNVEVPPQHRRGPLADNDPGAD